MSASEGIDGSSPVRIHAQKKAGGAWRENVGVLSGVFISRHAGPSTDAPREQGSEGEPQPTTTAGWERLSCSQCNVVVRSSNTTLAYSIQSTFSISAAQLAELRGGARRASLSIRFPISACGAVVVKEGDDGAAPGAVEGLRVRLNGVLQLGQLRCVHPNGDETKLSQREESRLDHADHDVSYVYVVSLVSISTLKDQRVRLCVQWRRPWTVPLSNSTPRRFIPLSLCCTPRLPDSLRYVVEMDHAHRRRLTSNTFSVHRCEGNEVYSDWHFAEHGIFTKTVVSSSCAEVELQCVRPHNISIHDAFHEVVKDNEEPLIAILSVCTDSNPSTWISTTQISTSVVIGCVSCVALLLWWILTRNIRI